MRAAARRWISARSFYQRLAYPRARLRNDGERADGRRPQPVGADPWPDGRCIAALTCPYIALVERAGLTDISQTITMVMKTAGELSLLAGSDVRTPA